MTLADISPQQSPELDPALEQQQEIPRRKKDRLLGWLPAILLIGGGVTGGIVLWQVFASNSAPIAESSTETPPFKPVETIPLKSGVGNRQIRLLGQVEAGKRATLSSQLDGTLHRVLVKEGDRVTPGMTVAVLDDADQRLALASAEARLAQEKANLARLQVGTRPEIMTQRRAELAAAEAREVEANDNLQRVSGLAKAGALPQRTLVEARSEANAATSEKFRVKALLAEAEAGPTKEELDTQESLVAAAHVAEKQAELEMLRTQIRATFLGIVQSRDADPGDYVEASDSILTIVSDRTLDIFLELPERLSGQVTPGMRVTLNARALPDWQQTTRITAVVPTANTASRRQRVRVTLDNPPPRLLPGMAIQANLTAPVDRRNTFTVPRDALTRRRDEWLLFVVDDGRVQALEVEMVADLGQEVIIANPELREGQDVVVTGGDGLADDAAVQIVN